jgi:large subunit ribosomal protein L13
MNSLNKTFLPTQNYTNRNWFIIDCKGQRLGRLATVVASLLKGKTKPHYYPSIDIGDSIILINADSIIVDKDKKHYIVNNPGRPGHSLKIKKVSDSLPKFTIERAIKGMLSTTEKKRLITRVRIYNDTNHLHQAQNPIEINVSNIYKNSNISSIMTNSI